MFMGFTLGNDALDFSYHFWASFLMSSEMLTMFSKGKTNKTEQNIQKRAQLIVLLVPT